MHFIVKLAAFVVAIFVFGKLSIWFESELKIYLAFNMSHKERTSCVLENLPGASNDVVTEAILEKCNRFPTNPRAVGRFNTMLWAEDCVVRYANSTASVPAQLEIKQACYAFVPSFNKDAPRPASLTNR